MNVLGGACLSRRGPLLCFLFTLILQFVCDVESQSGCRSGEYTTSGECCEQCHPGFGVTSPCLDDNTKCDRCWDGMTFSSGWSHTEPCRTCTMCQRPMHMRVPCTEADDTICECEDGFFSAPRNGGCIPCNECKPGMGVGMVCTPDSNTLCETCPIGFFSDVISNREPCLPCTLCLGDQDILQDCTPTSDSICFNKDPPPFDLFPPYEFPENNHHGEEVDRPDDFEPLPGLPPLEDWTDFIPTEQDTLGKAMFPDLPSWATVTSGAPHMEEAASMETNSTMPGFGPSSRDIIPVYCSIMAAVVVGLVAYVVFKRWHSCKNVEGSKARAEYSVTPTAVEKQHHGSGESVEPQAGGEATAIPIDGKEANDCQWTFSALAPQTQEEVERLLSTGKEENGGENHAWRNLAVALGYTTEEVEELATSERPAQTLLDDWSKRDGASKEHLFSTLSDLGRDDVIGQMQAIITPEAVV